MGEESREESEMIDYTRNEAGEKASQEHYKKIMNLYEQYRRDPNNPNEYIGLNDKEKELKKNMIYLENDFLMKRIEEFVEDSYTGKPYKVLVYKDGGYKYSLFETIKSIIQYYIKKLRKRELWWKGNRIV